jgi:hypothetical protein
MKRMIGGVLVLLLCGVMTTATALAESAQNFTVPWAVAAGGGGSSQGGNFSIQGTPAQPAARVASGGGLSLTSGFWPVVVNHAPTLENLADMTADAEQIVTLSGIGPGSSYENDAVTLQAESSDASLFSNLQVEYTGGATGTLRFTPAPGLHGSATITVTANDGRGYPASRQQSFRVTIPASPAISHPCPKMT